MLDREWRISTTEGVDQHIGTESNANDAEAGSTQFDRLAEEHAETCRGAVSHRQIFVSERAMRREGGEREGGLGRKWSFGTWKI